MEPDYTSEDADSAVIDLTGQDHGQPALTPSYAQKKKRSRKDTKGTDISVLKDQNDIANLLSAYEAAYIAQNESYFLGRFGGRAILKTQDGACFQANPYVAVNRANRTKDGVSNTIYDTLLNMIAFHMCVGTRSISFPKNFKVSVMNNHDNSHWTSVNATLTGDRHIRRAFGGILRDYQSTLGDDYIAWDSKEMGEVPYSLINRAKNFLIQQCKGGLQLPLPFTHAHLNFMDSLSAESRCNDIARLSCAPFIAATEAEVDSSCPQTQKGSTCADHSTLSGFIGCVMGTIPEVSSHELRKITNDAARESDVASAIDAISEIMSSVKQAKRIRKG